jgi:glycosyltransferase involved in cell wall biosynthesis
MKLGYITPVRAYLSGDAIFMQAASGCIADELAQAYDTVYICARVVRGNPPAPTDLPLQSANIELIAQPYWNTSVGALPLVFGIAWAYGKTCRHADAVLVRSMCPYIAILYFWAWLFQRPVCHWIVGNPIALLNATRRKGKLHDACAWLYAWQDRAVSKVGRWLTNGSFLCNGRELARAYRSPRTVCAVSSSVRSGEIFVRADTCTQDRVRILFVGYIRPEKGIEFLLQAVRQLDPAIQWELEIVGPDQFAKYREELDRLVERLEIGHRVQWSGYLSYGQPIFDCMRAADIFVLPTLSEGTPHVLTEARAQGLPCISTAVGGVPSTVRHGYDSLLVPPRNAEALARAITRLIINGNLRRRIIRNGYDSVRGQTLAGFAELVRRQLEPKIVSGRAVAPQS